MTMLYRGAWTGTEGPLENEHGNYTTRVLFWIEKLSQLNNKEISSAFDELEKRVEAEAASGKQSFPPSYAEFIGIARSSSPAEKGLPDVYAAYIESCNKYGGTNTGQWSHMVTYTAAKETGSHLLRTAEEKRAFPVYKRNFESALKRFRAGEDL